MITSEMQRIGENFRAACALAEPAFRSSANGSTLINGDDNTAASHEIAPPHSDVPSAPPYASSPDAVAGEDEGSQLRARRRQAYLAELARMESELMRELERRRVPPASRVDRQIPQGAMKVL